MKRILKWFPLFILLALILIYPMLNLYAQTGHRVTLTWDASTDTVAGYNVYRGATSGGPYTKQNSSVVTGLSYADTSVAAGTTYFYVARSVGTGGIESANSNQASDTVPINPPTGLGATAQ